MRDPECLYALAFVPLERLEGVLLDAFAPIMRDIQGHPDLDSLFFVRFSDPGWQIRFRVLGRREWVAGGLRDRLGGCLAGLEASGRIEAFRFARYDRELDRYGGELGMALAERLFFADSMAAIELCEADRRGLLRKSRREIALLLVDRMLDLARFDPHRRIAFYRHGYAWAIQDGYWTEADRALLEQRFRNNLPGLQRLFEHAAGDAELWGSESAAVIARRFLERAAPILAMIIDEHAAGRVHQEPVYLLWSYAHMFTYRKGIDSGAVAILRLWMHRYLEERRAMAL